MSYWFWEAMRGLSQYNVSIVSQLIVVHHAIATFHCISFNAVSILALWVDDLMRALAHPD